MRRLRCHVNASQRRTGRADSANAAQRHGLRAIRRRVGQAAAGFLVLIAAAAARSAMLSGSAQLAYGAAGGGNNSNNSAVKLDAAPLTAAATRNSTAISSDTQTSGISSFGIRSPPLSVIASGNVTRGPPVAEVGKGAASPPPHYLPDSTLTTAPNSTLFEVFPGCSAHAYGVPGLPNFVVYCEDGATGHNVSYWHQVPLNLTTDPRDNSTTMWVTVEIPRGTNAKIETQTMWPHAPMAQATVDGMAIPQSPRPTERLRYYHAGPSLASYGGIPQTWEASDRLDDVTGLFSDNDPLDFIEIGDAPIPVGGVVRVRLLGALALIDQDETDWKMVVLNTRDSRIDQWRDVSDVPPDTRRQLYEFFRTYKVLEGKAANTFFLSQGQNNTSRAEDWNKAFFGRDLAVRVVQAKHEDWQRLLGGAGGGGRGGCSTSRCLPLLAAARQDGSVADVMLDGSGGERRGHNGVSSKAGITEGNGASSRTDGGGSNGSTTAVHGGSGNRTFSPVPWRVTDRNSAGGLEDDS